MILYDLSPFCSSNGICNANVDRSAKKGVSKQKQFLTILFPTKNKFNQKSLTINLDKSMSSKQQKQKMQT